MLGWGLKFSRELFGRFSFTVKQYCGLHNGIKMLLKWHSVYILHNLCFFFKKHSKQTFALVSNFHALAISCGIFKYFQYFDDMKSKFFRNVIRILTGKEAEVYGLIFLRSKNIFVLHIFSSAKICLTLLQVFVYIFNE